MPIDDLENARKRFVEIREAEIDSLTNAALHGRIGSVPVDVVNYPYPLLNPTEEGPGGFAVASLEDLAVMKLAATARRGIRRDFWDPRQVVGPKRRHYGVARGLSVNQGRGASRRALVVR
ncbi:MAG TPA: hypothetical protein VGK73_10590 [Polyangiaceae bacterium]